MTSLDIQPEFFVDFPRTQVSYRVQLLWSNFAICCAGITMNQKFKMWTGTQHSTMLTEYTKFVNLLLVKYKDYIPQVFNTQNLLLKKNMKPSGDFWTGEALLRKYKALKKEMLRDYETTYQKVFPKGRDTLSSGSQFAQYVVKLREELWTISSKKAKNKATVTTSVPMKPAVIPQQTAGTKEKGKGSKKRKAGEIAAEIEVAQSADTSAASGAKDNEEDVDDEEQDPDADLMVSVDGGMPQDFFPLLWLPFVAFGSLSGHANPMFEGIRSPTAQPISDVVPNRKEIRATGLLERGEEKKQKIVVDEKMTNKMMADSMSEVSANVAMLAHSELLKTQIEALRDEIKDTIEIDPSDRDALIPLRCRLAELRAQLASLTNPTTAAARTPSSKGSSSSARSESGSASVSTNEAIGTGNERTNLPLS
jgi:hypothetical protein